MVKYNKYNDSQREAVRALYAMDRTPKTDDSYSKGRMTLRQISERTGVEINSVYKISHLNNDNGIS